MLLLRNNHQNYDATTGMDRLSLLECFNIPSKSRRLSLAAGIIIPSRGAGMTMGQTASKTPSPNSTQYKHDCFSNELI